MNHQQKTFFIFLVTLLAVACNPAHKLQKDQYLLNKNDLSIDNASVSREDLKGLIKQKPNRKILGFRFHLWLYNTVDKEKTERKKEAWVLKTKQKNELRKAKGKKEIDTDQLIFREKLLNIGEEPAILDSALTEKTKKQFQLYLFHKGFFNATVKDSVYYKKNHQATVHYTIHCGEPYALRNINYSSKDAAINDLLATEKNNSLLHTGDHYDEDVLEKERDRLATVLRNKGYFYFNKNYITYFDSDSSLDSHQVDIYLYANRMNENTSPTLNLTIEDHEVFRINNVFIQTDYDLKEANAIPKDTVLFNNYYFLSDTMQDEFRKEAILRTVFIRHGDLFQQKELDYTYSRLLDLNVFKFIKISFKEVPRDSIQKDYLLNCIIQLSASPKQDYSIETEATNSGGNLGAAGSFDYRNKNAFKGAELFEFKIKGAVEALRNFNDSVIAKKLFFFNTFEIGPEVNLNLKKFLFFPKSRTSPYINPNTNLSAGFDFQTRPDYTRRIANLSYAYVWKQTATQSWSVYLADVNSVKVNLSTEFNNKLHQPPIDLTLINSYHTHLTPGSRVTYIYSNQILKPNRSYVSFKVNLEWAGFTFAPLINAKEGTPKDDDGVKTIFGVPYAQYVKPDVDFSYHQRLNQHNMLVYRTAVGIGIEGPNSSSLPFEKSFFAGGANSLRAWQARTLGPGSYNNAINIEQSGDLKFESNIEVRTQIIKVLETAAFVDAGNIWTRHPDDARPGSQFEFSNFQNELAIGAGLGLRFNFTFFILRLDGAVKLHDPSLDVNERWVYTHQQFQLKDVNLNLAIGYPF